MLGRGRKAGQRRRRFYKLTATGQKILAERCQTWKRTFCGLGPRGADYSGLTTL